MSFFNGNSPRPERREGEPPRTQRPEPFTANDLLATSTPEPPRFTSEPRPIAGTGPTAPERCENVLAAGAKWKGTLQVDTSVRVDGQFSGQIESKATVHVAAGAMVDAKIRAAYVAIAGSFRGEIRCEQRVDLLPQSRVDGEIITKVLAVEEGAIFDGHVQMTAGESARNGRSRTPAAVVEPEVAALESAEVTSA
jgi:cytoskeletal protein CcmA (bactofilin family)